MGNNKNSTIHCVGCGELIPYACKSSMCMACRQKEREKIKKRKRMDKLVIQNRLHENNERYTPKTFNPNEELDEVIKKADAAGMSYGQYVAAYLFADPYVPRYCRAQIERMVNRRGRI